MEPPLKSRFPWIIPDALQAPRFGSTTFPPVTPCSIDRALPGGGSMVTCLPVLRQISFAPSGGRV